MGPWPKHTLLLSCPEWRHHGRRKQHIVQSEIGRPSPIPTSISKYPMNHRTQSKTQSNSKWFFTGLDWGLGKHCLTLTWSWKRWSKVRLGLSKPLPVSQPAIPHFVLPYIGGPTWQSLCSGLLLLEMDGHGSGTTNRAIQITFNISW